MLWYKNRIIINSPQRDKTVKIGIITDVVRDCSTGIGKYSENLIQPLTEIYRNDEFVLIDYEVNIFNQKKLLLVNNCSQKFFKTFVWHNILPRKIAQIKFDYILNLTSCPHLYPYKQKEIFFVYDLSLSMMPYTHPLSGVIYNKLLFRKALKDCHKIITISENSKKDLINNYNIPDNKIEIIYPIISKQTLAEKRPRLPVSNQYILYIGTIESRKNITTLVRAYHFLVKNKNFVHKLILCGKEGLGYTEIHNLIGKLNLQEKVLFTGYVTDAEKKYLYKHADLFVYPSLYEGFGIPPLEAMGYGCPVITSNVSSLPEVVGNAGLMINPHSELDLALAIDKMINNRALRNQMIKRGFRQARKFSSCTNINNLFT